MKIWIIITMVSMVLVTSACTESFMLKKHKLSFYFCSDTLVKYELLCPSGDMEKVLADTSLSKEMADSLYKYICSAERSGKKSGELYASMTTEQRKDLKAAFQANGYEINAGYDCGDY